MQFVNDAQLNAFLLMDFSRIINELSDAFLEKLKEIIEQVVYDPFTPLVYDRKKENGGFLGSWRNSSNTNVTGNTIQSTIDSDPDSMVIDRESFTHGSVLNYGAYHSDIREALAEIINEGKSGPYFDSARPPHWWKSPRPFWETFIVFLDSDESNKIFETIMSQHGIIWKRV